MTYDLIEYFQRSCNTCSNTCHNGTRLSESQDGRSCLRTIRFTTNVRLRGRMRGCVVRSRRSPVRRCFSQTPKPPGLCDVGRAALILILSLRSQHHVHPGAIDHVSARDSQENLYLTGLGKAWPVLLKLDDLLGRSLVRLLEPISQSSSLFKGPSRTIDSTTGASKMP